MKEFFHLVILVSGVRRLEWSEFRRNLEISDSESQLLRVRCV
jgi:hypothetical protein